MRHLLVIGLVLLAASCRKDQIDYKQRNSYYQNITADKLYDSSLLVMTYNIQLGFRAGQDPWTKDDIGGTPQHLDSMATFLASTGVDIIALQEVPLDRSNTIVKRFLDSLGHRLHMNYAFAAHGYNDAYYSELPVRGQWGCAILSRYPIEEIESREVSYIDVWTRRSTLRARLRLSSTRTIDVYSLHHKPMQDYSDLRKTADFVHEYSLPHIVCGDFNTGSGQPLSYLAMHPFTDPGQMAVDMIFHSAEFQPSDVRDYPFLHLSDHSPISVRYKY